MKKRKVTSGNWREESVRGRWEMERDRFACTATSYAPVWLHNLQPHFLSLSLSLSLSLWVWVWKRLIWNWSSANMRNKVIQIQIQIQIQLRIGNFVCTVWSWTTVRTRGEGKNSPVCYFVQLNVFFFSLCRQCMAFFSKITIKRQTILLVCKLLKQFWYPSSWGGQHVHIGLAWKSSLLDSSSWSHPTNTFHSFGNVDI